MKTRHSLVSFMISLLLCTGTATADSKGKGSNDTPTQYKGMGGQGALPIPVVYNGWMQKLPPEQQESYR
jgi:hypothetical protein